MTSKARKSTTEANSQIHCYTTQMVSLTTLIGQALAVLTQAPKHSSSPKTTAHRWGSTHPHIQSLHCTVSRKHRKCYIGAIYILHTHTHIFSHYIALSVANIGSVIWAPYISYTHAPGVAPQRGNTVPYNVVST